jgi:glycosyltransferase involved in cell wall biosynthesis
METLRPGAPRVTVLLPVYDAERFLAEAVDSILAQTFSDFELLAIDDGSRDGSVAMLEEYARRDSRVRLVRQPHAGLVATLNTGLALARGEFVARMDADDVSLSKRLALQISALTARPDVVCIGGAFDVIDAENRLLNRVVQPCEHAAMLAMALGGRSPICGSNVVFRRREVLAIGGFDAGAAFVEDLDLWLRLAEAGRLANLPDVISRVRFHDASVSATEQERQLDGIRDVVNRARARRGIAERIERPAPWRPLATRGSRHAFAVNWALSAWRIGERRTALAYALRALRIDPLGAPLWKGLARGCGRLVTRSSCPR